MYKKYKKISLLFSTITFVIIFSVTSFCDTSANVTSEGTIVTTDGTTGNFGWVEENGNWRFIERDGEYAEDTMKKSNDNTYYIDENGYMVTDYLYTDDNNNTYYFSETGAMVTHLWVAISPDKLENEKWNAEYFYMYFQDNGKAIKGKEGEGKKKTIEGKTYFFDEDGVMLTGWISKNGEHMDSENSDDWYGADSMYFALDDGSLAEGWLKWQDTNREGENDLRNYSNDYLDESVLYFYFDPKTHKKYEDIEKTINGRKYRFAIDNGRMLTKWEETEIDEERRKGYYTPLEYIESDETNYIDTLYKHKKTIEVTIDFMPLKKYPNLRAGIYGTWVGGDTDPQRFLVCQRTNASTHVECVFWNIASVIFSTGGADNRPYIEDYIGENIIRVVANKDDVNVSNLDTEETIWIDSRDSIPSMKLHGNQADSTSLTDHLFNVNGSQSSEYQKIKMRLYRCIVKDATGIVRDYVPCVLNETVVNAYDTGDKTKISYRGEFGLWDRANDKFYPKKAGNDFIPGPEIINYKYYNEDIDGSLSKNEWVYEVPSGMMSEELYDNDKKEWFYADKAGFIVKGTERKVNNKNYIFDNYGVMKTGIVVLYRGKYYCTIDLENTTYEDFIRDYKFYPEDKNDIINNRIKTWGNLTSDDMIKDFVLNNLYSNEKTYTIKYFGDDGAEVNGKNIKIQFSDGEYLFNSNKKGAYLGWKDKKYYQNGFLLKANEGQKYGLFYDLYNMTNGSMKNLYKYTHVKPELLNYFDMRTYCINNVSNGSTLIDTNPKNNGYPKWVLNMPYRETTRIKSKSDINKSMMNKLMSPLHSMASNLNLGNVGYVADKNGKVLKKGVYKDGDIYWVVDNNNQFVGKFEVPIKWGTTIENANDYSVSPPEMKDIKFDIPYYKSDIIDANGEIKYDQWIKFLDKDAYGKTEADYVSILDEEDLINLNFGDTGIEQIKAEPLS